ncbi:CRAL-TRIO domain-containing protein C23B6.04c [Glycine soja]|nr:CRAL-TRIO domain-containing protein C23B6.04c [Glycine soja]
MLEDTLKWRSTYKPEDIRWDEVAMEGATGKLYRASFHDREGRIVLVLRPGMQNTSSIENQMRHLVYMLENAMLNLPQGQEQMSWLIDFTGWSFRNSVPIKSAKETINILQNHYPERLAIKTIQKMKFVYPNNKDSVELMKCYFDEENLPIEFGGKGILNYNHEEFSRLMARDDLKSAAFWGSESDDKLSSYVGNKSHSGAEVAPEPAL